MNLKSFTKEMVAVSGMLLTPLVMWGFLETAEVFQNITAIGSISAIMVTISLAIMGVFTTVVGVVSISYVIKLLKSTFSSKGSSITA